jgi:uncharacterized repeat protein (TIGR03803 family)
MRLPLLVIALSLAALFAAHVASAQTFQVPLTFHGTDGSTPMGTLVQGTDGNLYGTTLYGGTNSVCLPRTQPPTPAGCGTIFQATPEGALSMLYSFCSLADCTDGDFPWAGLALGSNGNFYGTTSYGGGGDGIGTVFQLVAGQGLVSMANISNDNTISPGVVEGADGNIYGASNYGGAFQLTPTGALTTIYSFPEGFVPTGSLVQGTDGNFYGTTTSMVYGATGSSVFQLSPEPPNGCPSGSNPGNGWCETVLHSFCSLPACADGLSPEGGLVEGSDGNFYGTTSSGGANDSCSKEYETGCGTIFRITPGGVLTTLYSFCSLSKCADGAIPYGGLVLGSDGNFYGTTTYGGAGIYGLCDKLRCGTFFRLTPGGSLTTLHSFCSSRYCSDGGAPYAAVIEASGGTFYGTTALGGAYGCGCGEVFSWSPSVAVAPTFTPPSLTWAKQAVGTTSNPKSVKIKNVNSGEATLDLNGMNVASPFAISKTTCGAALAAGKSCEVSITFTPSAPGTATGTFALTDNAANSPQTLTLTGTGK